MKIELGLSAVLGLLASGCAQLHPEIVDARSLVYPRVAAQQRMLATATRVAIHDLRLGTIIPAGSCVHISIVGIYPPSSAADYVDYLRAEVEAEVLAARGRIACDAAAAAGDPTTPDSAAPAPSSLTAPPIDLVIVMHEAGIDTEDRTPTIPVDGKQLALELAPFTIGTLAGAGVGFGIAAIQIAATDVDPAQSILGWGVGLGAPLAAIGFITSGAWLVLDPPTKFERAHTASVALEAQARGASSVVTRTGDGKLVVIVDSREKNGARVVGPAILGEPGVAAAVVPPTGLGGF